jgi:hypothetical protein
MILMTVLYAGRVQAADCTATSVNRTPIDDLGSGLYLGQYLGGLYPNGLNTPPAAHAAEGQARALAIEPLDSNGGPSPAGKIVLLSIGMSNTTQEFCSQSGAEPCDPWTFVGQALAHPDVNHTTLVMANGARSGQAATSWDSPTDANFDRVRDDVLAPKGLTEAQVQVVWVKLANPQPAVSLPDPNADAFGLQASLGDSARAVKTRYPNCTLMFLSSRIYAGYADTNLNPEPYAYESAFSIKWLIEAQIHQTDGDGTDPVSGDLNHADVVPWLGWGPYPWADGTTARSDGLTWDCADLESDGTHPAQSGEAKVGTALLTFMLDAPYTQPWFCAAPTTQAPAASAASALILMSTLLLAGALVLRRRYVAHFR